MSTPTTRLPLQTVHESVLSDHRKDDKTNTRISSSKSRTDEPHIGKYRLIKTIGKGNFAKVKLAKHVPTGRELIGGDVYHYHTKLMKKPAKIGGKHVWHQDYGYWYSNGNLFPNMITTFIAVDKCTKENSCLQVLKGSNRCGRIEHSKVGGQLGANMERVKEIAKVCPLEHVEMDPGDALFFHCNLLHCSGANTSSARRWAFLCAYNRVDNNPIKDHHHPRYTPLEKVPDTSVLECQDFTTMDGKWFLDPEVERVLNVTSRKLAPTEQ